MLADVESDCIERKESLRGDAARKVREAVCALANDLPDHRCPGVVFVGATDSGHPSHLSITDELLRTLADIKTDGRIVPPPSMTVEKRSLLGSELAVLTVQPSDSPPVRFEGKIWIRVGPRRAIATGQDERILNERRRYLDRTFDCRPNRAARLEDLNLRFFQDEYLPRAVAPDVLAANDRTPLQQLAATKMIASTEAPVPTALGLLSLCSRVRDYIPGAYVQFLRIAGTTPMDPILDEALIDGAFHTAITRVEERLAAHNHTTVDFIGPDREVRSQPYPQAALQQLVRNAVLHRTYEGTHAPVRVYWFSDRIEIQSPGGPFGSVTAANFGDPGLTDYRNPALAEAFRVLGFAQQFGFGIQIARQLLSRNGNPEPRFSVSPTHVLTTVRP